MSDDLILDSPTFQEEANQLVGLPVVTLLISYFFQTFLKLLLKINSYVIHILNDPHFRHHSCLAPIACVLECPAYVIILLEWSACLVWHLERFQMGAKTCYLFHIAMPLCFIIWDIALKLNYWTLLSVKFALRACKHLLTYWRRVETCHWAHLLHNCFHLAC